MAKLWAGRTAGNLNSAADDFNTSLPFDCRLYAADIKGSIAHADMLAKQGIITAEEKDKITEGLVLIKNDIDSGVLTFSSGAEDIHMFVEEELTKRIGSAGKKLHTARSRNDQVALDIRIYLRDECDAIASDLEKLIGVIKKLASENKETVMPGYTHMQKAQPVSFAHHILAYAFMFKRDIGRLSDCRARMNVSPLGSCALAGTTYPTDRAYTASLLGFDGITENTVDGVSDRDFCRELLSALSILMMHLSRLSEELVLWSSWEFRFIKLSDEFTTGSSIMPQKKNPDMAELIRGKTGRVYGDLMALLTTLKGLPLAYNKDMQEDKEAVFDAVDTVKICLQVAAPMIAGMTVLSGRMKKAAQEGFINATDLADYLVKKGMPFRSAYKISGEIVALCMEKGLVLEELELEEYQKFSELFEADVYGEIDLVTCMEKRISEGGTSGESVKKQIEYVKAKIEKG